MRNTTRSMYLLPLIAAFAVLFAYAQKSEAVEAEVNASVSFVQSLSLVAEQLEFGVLSFTQNAAANDVTIAADGSLTCSNTAEYICPESGKAGEVSVAGSLGSMINISCDSSAVLSNGSDVLSLEQIKLSNGLVESTCGGINATTISIPLLGDAEQDMFKMGAKLVITENGVTGASTYSTGNSGGQPIAVRITYQ